MFHRKLFPSAKILDDLVVPDKAIPIKPNNNFKSLLNRNSVCGWEKNSCHKMRAGRIQKGVKQYQYCCCMTCFAEIGYLKYIPESKLQYYKDKWNDNTGFWDVKKGCRLDNKHRSLTCFVYICCSAEQVMSTEKADSYETFSIRIDKIEKKIETIIIDNLK